MGNWHLKPNPKMQNGKRYTYYDIAENFIDAKGKHQKKKIKYLGLLSPEKVQATKLALRVFNQEDLLIFEPTALEYIDSKRYLDVALMNLIFDDLGLNKVFHIISDKNVGTGDVAKILCINRCLNPLANYKTVDWLKDSYLPGIMGIDPEKYNKDKIFRELGNIYNKRKFLKKHFATMSKKFNQDELELYFFDGTTSYFEGNCCSLADAAKDKTSGYQEKVILICLVTDKKGFPINWDVFSGKKRDVKEFQKIAASMAEEQGIKEVTFCFDRGVASVANFQLIENELQSKYISGLDRNQIERAFNVDQFCKILRPKILEYSNSIAKETRSVPIDGFCKLGRDRFYKDLGVKEGKRYVVSFNVKIYEKEQQTRKALIDLAKNRIDEINQELQTAKKYRDERAVENTIVELLKKYRLTSVFANYQIIPMAVNSNGHVVQSHKIEYSIDEQALNEVEKEDGILVYITNHTEKENGRFKVSAFDIVSHYKDKYVIENAFRYLKSIEDLRPFYVYLPEHVNAHVDICMTAYFINTYIYHKLRDIGMSLADFYTLLEQYARVCTLTISEKQNITLLKKLSKEITAIIRLFGASVIIEGENLSKIGIRS